MEILKITQVVDKAIECQNDALNTLIRDHCMGNMEWDNRSKWDLGHSICIVENSIRVLQRIAFKLEEIRDEVEIQDKKDEHVKR